MAQEEGNPPEIKCVLSLGKLKILIMSCTVPNLQASSCGSNDSAALIYLKGGSSSSRSPLSDIVLLKAKVPAITMRTTNGNIRQG